MINYTRQFVQIKERKVYMAIACAVFSFAYGLVNPDYSF